MRQCNDKLGTKFNNYSILRVLPNVLVDAPRIETKIGQYV